MVPVGVDVTVGVNVAVFVSVKVGDKVGVGVAKTTVMFAPVRGKVPETTIDLPKVVSVPTILTDEAI